MAEGDALLWLMAASAIIWFGISAYVAFLAVSQRSLRQRLQQLELMNHATQD